MSNRDIEQYYFEMFREHYHLPNGTVEYGDKPDVIIHSNIKIGIEITNFFLEDGTLSHSEQVQRRARDQVLLKARRIYDPRNEKRFEITFGFDRDVPIRNQNTLAEKIADLTARIETRASGPVRRSDFQNIPELSFVYIVAGNWQDPQWRISQVYTTPNMSLDSLQTIIRVKEAKSIDYKQCNAYWLLIVVDFMDRAQDQDIQIDDFDDVRSDVFEKIIVYKTFFGVILEKTTAAY